MKNKIIKLIKILLIGIFLLLFLLGSTYITHEVSVKIYEPIGYDKGIYQTNKKLINKIIQVTENMPKCKKEEQHTKKFLVGNQKQSIYITERNKNKISFFQVINNKDNL